MDESEFVEIRHPKLKNRPPARVTRASFDHSLKAQGWRLAKAKKQEQNPAEGQPDEE